MRKSRFTEEQINVIAVAPSKVNPLRHAVETGYEQHSDLKTGRSPGHAAVRHGPSVQCYKTTSKALMIAPVMNRWIRQKPMISLAFNPAMASMGSAQNG